MKVEIVKYKEEFKNEIIQIWERSVRATHTFLKEEDLLFYKSEVAKFDFGLLTVYCVCDEHNSVVGFLGTSNQKLEMLFLAPEYIGKGIGKQLMEFALDQLQVKFVDVNEDNIKAVEFYQKYGFRQTARKALDGYAKPYPILEMELV